jgi:Carboxypeptidase regulatory-like domain
MKKISILALALLLVGLSLNLAYAEKNKGDGGRLLIGKVLDHGDNPLPGSIVYLSNTRTQTVKTYIVGDDGAYRFPALSPNIDYEIYAQHKGRKSETKTVSSFDNRTQVNIVLRIDTK